MKKICVVGYILSNAGTNGQEIRTKSVLRALNDAYMGKNVTYISYAKIKSRPISTILKYIIAVIKNDVVIIFPAQNAVRVLTPIALFFGKIFNTKVLINVIGGWLPDLCKQNTGLFNNIKKVDALFVQTSTLKKRFEEIGIKQTYIFPNFKYCLPKSSDFDWMGTTKKLCFLSRVTPKKGVIELINVVNSLIKDGNDIALDIYGTVDLDFEEEFEEAVQNASDKICYMGPANPSETVDIMSKYYLQIFPTCYYTEGFPGSILDSIYASTPVIASRWESYKDIIDEEKSIGITYEFNNSAALEEAILYLIKSPELVKKMKENCVTYAEKYKPEEVIKVMTSVIDEV